MTPSMDGWMDKSHDAIHGSIESPELKDGVIGGDHNEEREVSEHAEFETGWIGEDEEKGKWVVVGPYA